MSAIFESAIDTASHEQILAHLAASDADFVADLGTRVNLPEYARKIATQSTRVEAWHGGELIGLVALYANDSSTRVAFVTHVSVAVAHHGRGIGRALLVDAMALAATRGMARVDLEVATGNARARRLYRALGFLEVREDGGTTIMSRALDPELEQHDDRA